LQGDTLKLVQQLTDELLNDIRSVVSTLRAHEGIDLSRALASLAALFQTPKVVLDLDPALRVPALGPAQALLRTAQEALSNAARHGLAKNVRISLTQTDTCTLLRIEDDGRGRLPVAPGNGLLGMRERIEEQGGALVIE
jgi:signal transduction histidine kinase